MPRNRIIVAFDEDYLARGVAVYSAVRLLTEQMGAEFQYFVGCQGRYDGPRFDGAAKVRVSASPRAGSLLTRARRHLDRLLLSAHLVERPDRWASNLEQIGSGLLARLFAADELHAIVVFTTKPAFALRLFRIAHACSSGRAPHLIVVTQDPHILPQDAADLVWLGARTFRDRDMIPFGHRSAERAAPREDSAIPAFSFVAADEYPRQLGNPAAQIEWRATIGPERAFPKRVRDIVLFVRPDWMNCGSGTTFENLAGWFRGRDALLIDVGIHPFADNFDAASRDAQIAQEQDHIRAAVYFAVRRSGSLPYLIRQLPNLGRWIPKTWTLQKLLQNCLAAKPPVLRAALRHAKISQIYVNHYFTIGWAHEFIGGRPFFLDTHDVQAINVIHHGKRNALTGRMDRFEVSLRDEMEISGTAARLGFVAPDELDLASRFIDPARLDYILPLPNVVPCGTRALRQPATLLMVASLNPANIQNMDWFLDRVWPVAMQQSEGASPFVLRVCGTIGTEMTDVNRPGVRIEGLVDDLRGYYDDSDLVLLPIITGGGVAIKTLEAILFEKPVLATRHALRGLPDNVVRCIGFEDDPALYARALLALVSDPVAHRAAAERSRQAAALLRQYPFYQILGEAMDAVRLPGPDQTA